MQLVVGLGNPGIEYSNTRHNVGFQILDLLADKLQTSFSYNKKLQGEVAKSGSVFLLKPQTFMNSSGESVRATLDYYFKDLSPEEHLNSLFVIHDDLDLPIGKYKIQKAKGPKGHNGLLSMYEQLGSDQFYHVRIGVENRGDLRALIPGHTYVLAPFEESERKLIEEVKNQVLTELYKLLEIG